MSALDVALRYMEIFYSGRDLGRLTRILREDCQFQGPFFQFNSAQEYIASLKADPPRDCSYRILHAFEKDNIVNLIYEFAKPGITTNMSQLFHVQDGKIARILLIFDSAVFGGKKKDVERTE